MVKREIKVEERAFFAQYPGFHQNPSLSVVAEFRRLAALQGWREGSKTWKRHFNACMQAEYDGLIGDRVARLEIWQQLCRKLQIDDTLPSIRQCRMARLSDIYPFVIMSRDHL